METNDYSAFIGTTRVATGSLEAVLRAAWTRRNEAALVFFDHSTGAQRDFDWRGDADEVVARALGTAEKPGPGRPKLGVVSSEVTLLPRHWEWLAAQPARASGTLRRLVEEAMAREACDPKRRREALAKVLWALAGNEPGFEEGTRALFAGDRKTLEAIASGWSGDLPDLVAGWV